MTRTKSFTVAPLWLLLAAAAVLLLVLGQARPVLAPAGSVLPATSAAVSSTAGPTGAPSRPAPSVVTQRTIGASNPVAPAPPAAVTSPPAAPPAPGASGAQCPPPPRSGRPCVHQQDENKGPR